MKYLHWGPSGGAKLRTPDLVREHVGKSATRMSQSANRGTGQLSPFVVRVAAVAVRCAAAPAVVVPTAPAGHASEYRVARSAASNAHDVSYKRAP